MSDTEPDRSAVTPALGAPADAWPSVRGRLVTLWRAGRLVLGVVLIALGVLGCLLPVIPGVPLLIAGVALLGPTHPLVRPFAERVARWRRAREP
jgi:hypothetical protein